MRWSPRSLEPKIFGTCCPQPAWQEEDFCRRLHPEAFVTQEICRCAAWGAPITQSRRLKEEVAMIAVTSFPTPSQLGRRGGIASLMLCLSLAVLGGLSSNGQVDLISPGSDWKYLDDGSDQGTAWTAAGFNDAAWASGPAPLGYGNGSEATTNDFGPDPQNKYPAYYFRRTFNLANAASVTNLRARLQRDDGVVAYLNGMEIFRDNMPAGSIGYTNFASATAADDGQTFIPFSVDPSLLSSGNNVVAVEMHQANGSSSDIRFDLQLEGNPQPYITIDSPTNAQELTAVNVSVSGNAVPAGAAITLVEVFADGTKIGQSTAGDWKIVWNSVPPGTHTLSATIADSSGLMATSAPVNVVVMAPPSGTLIAQGSIWKYFIGRDFQEASEPTTQWRTPWFDDSTWSQGATPIGYGEADIVTTLPSSAVTDGNYLSVFLRKTFTVSNPNAFQELTGTVTVDDGAAVYLNGTEIGRINVPDGDLTSGDSALIAEERRDLDLRIPDPGSILVAGDNVLTVHLLNGNQTSSDILVDAHLAGTIDDQAPLVDSVFPLPTATVAELNTIEVLFNEPVVGADASDLLINGEPATSLTFGDPEQLIFQFPEPPTGAVQVAFAANHGITDSSPLANPFDGLAWTYTLNPSAEPVGVVISEFMARNDHTLNDEDGDASDWIELYNAGSLSVNLGGWSLTDDRNNLTKWRIPSVVLLPNEFLVIFASGKNRTNVLGRLHTNFALEGNGEYLGLVDRGSNVVSEFSPAYPPQFNDVSYGRDNISSSITGYFETPTPGELNSASGSNIAPPVEFSMPSRTFFDAFDLTVEHTGKSTGRDPLCHREQWGLGRGHECPHPGVHPLHRPHSDHRHHASAGPVVSAR